MRPKLVEDDGNVLQMLRPQRAVDENIVEKDQHKPPQVGAKDIVHQRLECRWGIGEAERHHQELVVAVVGAEGGLGNVVGVHLHLVVARAQVELGEEARALELVEELINHWDRELVLRGLGVEGVVVDAETLGSTRLPH